MKLEKYLKEVKERSDAATEGPWWPTLRTVITMDSNDLEYDIPDSRGDAEFIAHARTDIPVLLDMLNIFVGEDACICEEIKEELENLAPGGLDEKA